MFTNAASEHDLHQAYRLLFGAQPPKRGLFLEETSLTAAFGARVKETHPDRARQLGRSRLELARSFEQVEKAYRFLLDLLGNQPSVMVAGWINEGRVGDEAPPAFLPADRLAKVRSATVASGAGLLDTPTRDISTLMPPVAPGHRVKLGRFLLSKGKISLQQLIDAVLWQRAQRPAVGKIAQAWDVLDQKQVYEVLLGKKHDQLFCSVAVDKGWMTPFQRLAILGKQRQLQQPIGQYFVEKGILSAGEMDELVNQQQQLDR